jgi:D-xylose transport system substrate-binding protein
VNLLRNSKPKLVALALSVGVVVAMSGASSSAQTVTAHQASISVSSFTNSLTALSQLKALAGKGKGKIAAILPDTTSSTRYTEFDTPDLKKAAKEAGLPSSDMIVQNGNHSDTQFLTDAKSDITNGASVLLIDPEDSGTGVQVENLAKKSGVAVIDYDRLDLGGPADPYVSFNNVNVGKLIGQGFESCVSAWGVKHPNVIMMRGAPTDNNATLFYEGYYNDVLKAKFSSGAYTLLANTAGTWNPTSPSPDALDEFKAAYTANPTANSAVIPNDENGAPIITYLQSLGVKPYTFPTTGQDSTLTGLQNIISGYQCGTVYKAVYKEAGAAVALALYLRAGKKAPHGLENGTTSDPQTHAKVPSVLLAPEWVTAKNMKSTVIADGFVPASQICAGSYKADCARYGIKP